MPVFVLFAAVAGAVVIGLLFWKQIMRWGYNAVLPWINTVVPQFYPFAEKTFFVVENVGHYIRQFGKVALQEIVQYWQAFRRRLLKQEMHITPKVPGQTYVRKMTNWFYTPENGEKAFTRQEIEQEINWYELPEDIRGDLMSNEVSSINITEERDREILTYEQALQ
jgi:hypothetical protein